MEDIIKAREALRAKSLDRHKKQAAFKARLDKAQQGSENTIEIANSWMRTIEQNAEIENLAEELASFEIASQLAERSKAIPALDAERTEEQKRTLYEREAANEIRSGLKTGGLFVNGLKNLSAALEDVEALISKIQPCITPPEGYEKDDSDYNETSAEAQAKIQDLKDLQTKIENTLKQFPHYFGDAISKAVKAVEAKLATTISEDERTAINRQVTAKAEELRKAEEAVTQAKTSLQEARAESKAKIIKAKAVFDERQAAESESFTEQKRSETNTAWYVWDEARRDAESMESKAADEIKFLEAKVEASEKSIEADRANRAAAAKFAVNLRVQTARLILEANAQRVAEFKTAEMALIAAESALPESSDALADLRKAVEVARENLETAIANPGEVLVAALAAKAERAAHAAAAEAAGAAIRTPAGGASSAVAEDERAAHGPAAGAERASSDEHAAAVEAERASSDEHAAAVEAERASSDEHAAAVEAERASSDEHAAAVEAERAAAERAAHAAAVEAKRATHAAAVEAELDKIFNKEEIKIIHSFEVNPGKEETLLTEEDYVSRIELQRTNISQLSSFIKKIEAASKKILSEAEPDDESQDAAFLRHCKLFETKYNLEKRLDREKRFVPTEYDIRNIAKSNASRNKELNSITAECLSSVNQRYAKDLTEVFGYKPDSRYNYYRTSLSGHIKELYALDFCNRIGIQFYTHSHVCVEDTDVINGDQFKFAETHLRQLVGEYAWNDITECLGFQSETTNLPQETLSAAAAAPEPGATVATPGDAGAPVAPLAATPGAPVAPLAATPGAPVATPGDADATVATPGGAAAAAPARERTWTEKCCSTKTLAATIGFVAALAAAAAAAAIAANNNNDGHSL